MIIFPIQPRCQRWMPPLLFLSRGNGDKNDDCNPPPDPSGWHSDGIFGVFVCRHDPQLPGGTKFFNSTDCISNIKLKLDCTVSYWRVSSLSKVLMLLLQLLYLVSSPVKTCWRNLKRSKIIPRGLHAFSGSGGLIECSKSLERGFSRHHGLTMRFRSHFLSIFTSPGKPQDLKNH